MAKIFKEAEKAVILYDKQIMNIADIPNSEWFSIGKVIFYKDYQGNYYHLIGENKIEKVLTSGDLVFKDNEGDSSIHILKPVEFKFKLK